MVRESLKYIVGILLSIFIIVISVPMWENSFGAKNIAIVNEYKDADIIINYGDFDLGVFNKNDINSITPTKINFKNINGYKKSDYIYFTLSDDTTIRYDNPAKKGEKPNIGLYTIVSPSMEPFIKVYDVIIDRKLKTNEELKVGDVITFYSSSLDTDGYTITHRIYDIKVSDGKTYYITKGDNNQSVDIGSITRENIVGKMIYKINGLGKIQFFLSSKLGWILIILIPALCFILYDLNKLNKIFKIKKKIDKIPEYQNMSAKEEIEHNKKVRALLEKSKWMK